VSGGVASNVINEHSGYYVENVHYTIVEDVYGNDIGVYINEGSDANYVWEFEAYDSQSDEPGYINYISIDPTDTVGPIKLSIVGAPGHTYGAQDVKKIDLRTNGDDTGDIVTINISGDLASVADVDCDNVTGDIDVGGNLAGNDIDVIEDIDGDITIGGLLLGDIEADALQNVTISGNGTHTGNITVRGDFVEVLTIGHEDESSSATMQGTVTITGVFQGNGDGYGGGGVIEIWGDMEGEFDFDASFYGRLFIHGDFLNSITIDGVMGTRAWQWYQPLIEIDGDFGDSGTDIISIAYNTGASMSMNDGQILIHGDMNARILCNPAKDFFEGEIYIDGSLLDATGDSTPEIVTGEMDYGDEYDPDDGIGITIDYDGYHALDEWEAGATISIDGTSYGYTTVSVPANHLWNVTECRGDLNNDGELTAADASIFVNQLYDEYEDYDPAVYLANYPGLGGSLYYHGDASGNGSIDAELGWPDENAVTYLGGEDCCVQDWSFCMTDLDCDGGTGLSDLGVLLSNYGMTSGAEREDGDISGDGDVDLSDLAALLGEYGNTCDCSGGFDSLGMDGSAVTVTVEAYDTGGYSGGGFEGEDEHFVFDLKIEVDDPNSDDWVVTGAVLEADNDATFRLSTTSTTPDQYATFVAAPWTSVPGSATAAVAGAYDPADPNEVFTTTDINLGWYDSAESNDGPATVMRIVIDVSEVSNADVSAGFGSVYFTTTGPTRPSDIFLADLTAEVSTADSAPAMESLSGEFYVKRDTGP